ncbi:MAG: hypothetical protein SPI65_04815 [Peptoniphilus sp.]|nr:hypothetical protein [Peptoniphilus sp.]MDD7362871.1 hypothetical protein [Bacillota bacterium]MDY6044888.1 hypothetical protein [Peptoniphilus sp.]
MDKNIKLTHPRFIDIDGDYGFDQRALKERWSAYRVDRACGVAALANLVSYGEGAFKMSGPEAIRRMDRVIAYAPPRPWGIPNAGILKRAIRHMRLPYAVEAMSGRVSGRAAYPFIARHLKADRPVALLNTNHPERGFRYHWVTVTELIREKGVLKVRFSSWGRRYKLDYDVLLSDKTLYRALMALVPTTDEERK